MTLHGAELLTLPVGTFSKRIYLEITRPAEDVPCDIRVKGPLVVSGKEPAEVICEVVLYP